MGLIGRIRWDGLGGLGGPLLEGQALPASRACDPRGVPAARVLAEACKVSLLPRLWAFSLEALRSDPQADCCRSFGAHMCPAGIPV